MTIQFWSICQPPFPTPWGWIGLTGVMPLRPNRALMGVSSTNHGARPLAEHLLSTAWSMCAGMRATLMNGLSMGQQVGPIAIVFPISKNLKAGSAAAIPIAAATDRLGFARAMKWQTRFIAPLSTPGAMPAIR